jgi:hypothetical protein
MKRILALLLFSLTGAAWSQVVDIGGTSKDHSLHKSLRIPPRGVVAVSLPSGQRALIQFSKLGDTSAEYRWKYRRTPKADVQVGIGRLFEKYEEMAPREGGGHEVLPLPGHDVIVRAGEIRAEWSAGGIEFCYIYFNPKIATATLVSAATFDAGP